jgi:hypothetical protein
MQFKTLFVISVIILSNSLFGIERIEMNFTQKPYLDKHNNLHLQLNVTNFLNHQIREVRIHYRDISETMFKAQRMTSQGFQYLASVNLSDLETDVAEYYFEVEYADGTNESYPAGAPETNLLSTSVQNNPQQDEGIIIISPEEDESIFTDELVITVSFAEFSSVIDKERIKMYLNTWDISRYLEIYDEFITFVPKQVPAGTHNLHLELYDRSGNLIAQQTWKFNAFQRTIRRSSRDALKTNGQFYAETRQEKFDVAGYNENYSYAGLNLYAVNKRWELGAKLFISNREKSNRQPINRYTGFTQINFWGNRYFRITGGDAYPQMNPIMVRNILLRGMYGQLFLGFFNLDLAFGNVQRGVSSSPIFDNTGVPIDSTVSAFRREMLAIRASFGSRKVFQFGLLAVKTKDDTGSVKIQTNSPTENLAVGTDIFLASPRQEVVLEGTFSVSLYNANITSGTIPYDSLQKLASGSWDDDTRSYYDFTSKFITINEFFVPKPNIAFDGRIRVRKYDNTFTIGYTYVEDDYRSLGQPFYLRDQRGFAISDAQRLFQNQLYLSAGFRQFKNNLANNKPDTTTNSYLYFNLSYFPIGNLPGISVGLNSVSRSNDLRFPKANNPVIPIDNRTTTVNFSTHYTFLTGNFDHRLSFNLVNYNFSDNIDNSTLGNNISNSITVNLRSKYSIPLITNVDVSFQQTENALKTENKSEFTLVSGGAGGEYTLKDSFTKNDALIFGTFARYGKIENISPLKNLDYNRFFINGRIIYNFVKHGRLSLNGDLINYNYSNQNFLDYILTVRYDINF